MQKIVQIRVIRTYESCQRTTYYVEIKTDEGFTMTPDAFATGSIYTNHEGLSIAEARDRAVTTAGTWGDFLKITPIPYEEDGVVYEPEMPMDIYTTRRELKERGQISYFD